MFDGVNEPWLPLCNEPGECCRSSRVIGQPCDEEEAVAEVEEEEEKGGV